MIKSAVPISHRGAWTARDHNRDDFTIRLTTRQLATLDNALNHIKAENCSLESITREHFLLPEMTEDIAAWRREVRDGHGMIILSGFPVDQYNKDEMAILHFGLGTHFGTAMSQSAMGDRLGHVINVGGKDPKERAYRNSMELAMHTDSCDIVAMMCLQKAKSGGYSGYVSAISIYNEVLERRPDLMPVLTEGFYYHRFGEELPGESPVTEEKIPVFSFTEDCLSINYLRSYIEMAAEETKRSLSKTEIEALDLVDEIAHSEEFALQFVTQPGEAVFFNNLTILHNRTAFDDANDEAQKRHFLRLWLVDHDPRPTAETLRIYEGRGIPKQAGKTTYFTGSVDMKRFEGGESKM